ncbi:MAG: DUF4925 domain-containing protein [Bacteroides sp.]|nr:DUF4925 domain-containing protein [Bacteroides sp.]
MNHKLLLGITCCLVCLFAACDDNKNEADLPINGTYSSSSEYAPKVLELYYSEALLGGKYVYLHTEDEKTATITLVDVIPGEKETVLTGVGLTAQGDGTYAFSGQYTDSGRSLTYSGTVEEKKMVLNVDVTLPQHALLGTWGLTGDPLIINWESSVAFRVNLSGIGVVMYPSQLTSILSGQLAPLVTSALQSVTFGADGNIVATYAKGGQWLSSPTNMVRYHMDGEHIRVFPDLEKILQMILLDTRSEQQEDKTLWDVIVSVQKLFTEGIPVGYRTGANGTAEVFIEQEVLEPFMDETILSLLSGLIGSDGDDDNILLSILPDLLEQLPAVFRGTSVFEAGLKLTQE